MRLVRHGAKGSERPGIIARDGQIRDLTGHVDDITPAILAPGRLAALARLDPEALPRVDAASRLGPPLTGIGKIVCVGLNYADHAAESGLPVPEKPVLFLKATTAINGPYDPVVLPQRATAGDWEVELAFVIGTRAQYVDETRALDHVAGYCVANDVSERNFSEEGGGQWTKGKSADTFAPIGPWLVIADEIPDPQSLPIWLEVNGRRMQESNTREMVFGVRFLVSYISRFMTLEPGDIVFTGTPYGTGYGRRPQTYLKPGDVMRLGIGGLGQQRLDVIAWSPDQARS